VVKEMMEVLEPQVRPQRSTLVVAVVVALVQLAVTHRQLTAQAMAEREHQAASLEHQ
jgi:hypothetical protein